MTAEAVRDEDPALAVTSFGPGTDEPALAVTSFGPGTDADAVLAIHGITANGRCWDTVAALLPERRILAPDLRGRARSNACLLYTSDAADD